RKRPWAPACLCSPWAASLPTPCSRRCVAGRMALPASATCLAGLQGLDPAGKRNVTTSHMAVIQVLQNACAWMMEMSVIAYVRNLRVGSVLTVMLVVFVLVFVAGSLGGLRLLQSASDWMNELGRGNVVRAHALSDATIALLRAQTLITDARIQMESGMEEERDALLASAREQL